MILNIDIETDGLHSDSTKRTYLICLYTKRDEEIYEKYKINVLDNMYIKATNYGIVKDTEATQKLVDERKHTEFYSIFSLEELCVLGY